MMLEILESPPDQALSRGPPRCGEVLLLRSCPHPRGAADLLQALRSPRSRSRRPRARPPRPLAWPHRPRAWP
eukprot:4362466-Pyramimonas_sp.AAC.1